jgi:hypothetical protein
VKLEGKKGQNSFNQKKKKLEDRILFIFVKGEDMNSEV